MEFPFLEGSQMFSSCELHNNLSKVVILGEKCYSGKYGAVESSQSRSNRHVFILIEYESGGQWPQYYKVLIYLTYPVNRSFQKIYEVPITCQTW